MSLTQQIKSEAHRLGFDLVGIARAEPSPDLIYLQTWLQKKQNAGMAWMERDPEKRADPAKVLPECRSMISLGINYHRGQPLPPPDPQRGWIARYAWGDDYHTVVRDKLEALRAFLVALVPDVLTRVYVDTGPVLERRWGERAGLGWIGKNTMLINRHIGSFFFIAEILTDLDLEPDQPDTDHCGTCTRCLDACPTQALTPHVLDANKCISYWTIEHRGEFPAGVGDNLAGNIFGCDICQDVCPWNRQVPVSNEVRFDPRPGFFHPPISELETMTQEDFLEKTKNSPVRRAKWEGLMRNIRVG